MKKGMLDKLRKEYGLSDDLTDSEKIELLLIKIYEQSISIKAIIILIALITVIGFVFSLIGVSAVKGLMR